jgi:hypothetical protein
LANASVADPTAQVSGDWSHSSQKRGDDRRDPDLIPHISWDKHLPLFSSLLCLNILRFLYS